MRTAKTYTHTVFEAPGDSYQISSLDGPVNDEFSQALASVLSLHESKCVEVAGLHSEIAQLKNLLMTMAKKGCTPYYNPMWDEPMETKMFIATAEALVGPEVMEPDQEDTDVHPGAAERRSGRSSGNGFNTMDSQESPDGALSLSGLKPAERWAEMVVRYMEKPHKLERHREEIDLQLVPLWQCTSTRQRVQYANSLINVGASGMVVAEGRASAFGLIPSKSAEQGELMQDSASLLQPLVRNPGSLGYLSWSIVGLVFIVWDLISLPLHVFDLGSVGDTMTVLALITFFYWVFDMPLQFLTGFEEAGKTEMRPHRTARRYLRTWFTMDLIIILLDATIFLIGAIVSDSGSSGLQVGSRSLRVTRLSRMGRLVRLMRVGKLRKLLGTFMNLINSEYLRLLVSMVENVIVVLIINHYVACTFYAIGFFSMGSTWTWIDQYDIESLKTMEQYTVALHWSLTQFAPATNNIYPQSFQERLFANAVVIFALIVFSSFISAITNSVNQLRRFDQQRLTDAARVREFIHGRRISMYLSLRIHQFMDRHYTERKLRVHECDISVFKEIPESMKILLHEEMFLPVLSTMPCLTPMVDLDKPLLVRVCHRAVREFSCLPRQDVFLDDSLSESIYCISQGMMQYRCYYDNFTPHKVRSGTWVSEMAMWVKWKHCGQLTAEATSEVIAIKVDIFLSLVAAFGGPLFFCLQKLAIYIVAYAEQNSEAGRQTTDISLPTALVLEHAKRAVRLLDMRGRGSLEDFLDT